MAGRVDNDAMRLRVIIVRDEHPDLFDALSQVHDPKRRAARLRALASKGVACGPHVRFAPGTSSLIPTPVSPGSAGPTTVPLSRTVDEMLDWEK
jgi:hypothetical protein